MKQELQGGLTMKIPHTFPTEFKEVAPLLQSAIERCWELLPEEERNLTTLAQRLFSVSLNEMQLFVSRRNFEP